MATCPAGHQSAATDYCDVCGAPMPPEAQGQAPVVATAAEPIAQTCPSCGASNAADALFCEACGYDYTTGTPSRAGDAHAAPAILGGTPDPLAVPLEAPAPTPVAVETPEPAPVAFEAPAAVPLDAVTPAAPRVEASPAEVVPVPEAVEAFTPASAAPAVPAVTSAPAPAEAPAPAASDGPVEWVVEAWIDPDWYATQGSTDPLPSPGLPDVIPLRRSSVLIGRVSVSRNIHPDIDCELDNGVSRRHAQLTSDGTRWWVEDLDSANGTFVAPAAGPLPAMPIPRGRTEVALDQRIYLGAWTRLVIRQATDEERQAFA